MSAIEFPSAAAVPPISRRRLGLYRIWLVLALIVVLGLLALAAPVDHDEDQYVAAAMLTAGLRPFADFLMLQTPLQAYLAAPIVMLFPGGSFVALREANALMAMALILLTSLAATQAGASRRAAMLAGLMVATCDAFLFSAGVFRNDMLSAALAAASIAAVLHALRQPGMARWWLAGGLAAGLATSTKISYAVPLVGMCLFLGVHVLRGDRRSLVTHGLPFLGGVVLGLAPILLAALRSPAAAWYGIVEYAIDAPAQWYGLNGFAGKLTAWKTVKVALLTMVRGPGLLALAAVCWSAIHGRHRRPDARRTLLWMMVGASLVAALLPMPSRQQYYVPLLMPLFTLFAVELTEWEGPSPALALLLVFFMVIGIMPRASLLTHSLMSSQWPALDVAAESHWVGQVMARSGLAGPIATLTPRLVLDSGWALDRRFATGPFFYRSGDGIADRRQALMQVVSPRTMGDSLDAHPPAAILTGYESFANIDRTGLDTPLRQYAISHGYRLIRSPFGSAELFERGGG